MGPVTVTSFDTTLMKTMMRAPMAGTCVGCLRSFQKYDFVFRQGGKYLCVECERGAVRR
jgi:hypothetical protein